jgi:predicted PhzF superfamily epimerase YddE/YHI9
LFDRNSSLAAVAGGESGYWVLRWPDGFDLARLRPDLRAIARSTGRAVIATAAGGDGDARLRYFAPQYGNDEDTVTGSACVVLADFWRDRLGDTLTFVQQSPRGGSVRTRHLGDSVEIGGRIEKVACRDDAEQPVHKENHSDHALRR